MNNKKKIVLYIGVFIVLIMISITGIYVYDEIYYKNNDVDNVVNNDDNDIIYNNKIFLKTSSKFKTFDFDTLLNYSINYNIGKINFEVKNNKIYAQVEGYNKIMIHDNKDGNVISIRATCAYDECCDLFYLTDENRVYSIDLKDFVKGGYKNNNLNLNRVLDATKTTSIGIYETYEDMFKCGNKHIIYKDLDDMLWTYSYNENKETFERKFYLEENYKVKFMKNNNSSGVYVVYESEFKLPEDSMFISDENDKELIAVNAFYGYFDKSNVKDTKFFVINNNNEIYVSSNNNLNNDNKLNLYNKKTVKNITDISDNDEYKVRIDYMDGSSEEIYTPYSYNEEYKF